MNVFKRIVYGVVYVGMTFATLFGLLMALAMFAYEDGTWLFRIGAALIIVALFIQGYTSGGGTNSETKTAD
ncbi:hypothetical protein [Paenibacillus xylanilyticus]|uniref:hypothetical protein n=1 Tax=Paenibacillus xylanilyticus TaxID=248903 RepID=UPI003AAA84DA